MHSEHRLSHVLSQTRVVSLSQLIAIIADEDTCVGFILAGCAEDRNGVCNFFIVNEQTTNEDIEEELKFYLKRKDIAFVIIDQNIANRIRNVVQEIFVKVQGRIIEIPPHYGDYDQTHDVVFIKASSFGGADLSPIEDNN